jgi:hypothetical protein
MKAIKPMNWVLFPNAKAVCPVIRSLLRIGVDSLKIIHDAKSRAGFALGAVMAAEFTLGKKGMLGMHDLLGF